MPGGCANHLVEAIFTALVENGVKAEMARVAGKDVFIPLGGAANLVLVQEDDIETAALKLAGKQGEVAS